MLPGAFAFQGFQPVAGRNRHIPNRHGRVQLQELAPGGSLNVRRESPGHLPVENLLRLRAREALNHFQGNVTPRVIIVKR